MKVFVIGRDPIISHGEVPIKLNDPTNTISRTHCKLIQMDDGTFILKDLNSKNGTFVGNNKILEGHTIQSDSIINLGNKLKVSAKDILKGKIGELNQEQISANDDSKNLSDQNMKNNDNLGQGIKRQYEIPDSTNSSSNIGSDVSSGLSNTDKANLVLSGASSATTSFASILAVIGLAFAVGLTAYFTGIFDQTTYQNSLPVFSSISYGEKWKTFSNEYYEFKYPESWIETRVGGEYAVARYAQDTVYFVVSLLECQQNVSQDDSYGIFHNGFACGMISKFKNEPSSYLSMGFQDGMSISQPFQTINGNYDWKYIAFNGSALNFGQLIEKMGDNIRRKTAQIEKKDRGQPLQFSKRNYHICNAATLYKNNILVSASAVAHNPEDDKLNDIFIKMIKSLKVKY